MEKTVSTKKRILFNLAVITLTFVVYFVLIAMISGGQIKTYSVEIINLICINIIAAVSLNMVTGMLGQLVLGHAGFMLVGGYAAAIFAKEVGWNLYASMPIALLLAGFTAAVLGFLIGVPALRLRGDYLAIITLGFGEIIRVFANNFSFTNGAKGYYGFPTFGRKQPEGLFSFVFLLAVFAIYFSYAFGTSRHGRAVISIREDEIAAESSGINTTYYKLLTFTISAFFAGVAGALSAFHVGVIDPARFDFNRSVEILMMVVLGGMGSITGSVLSASVLTVLPEFLRTFADYRMLVYSMVLVGVMLFRPQGLLGRSELQIMAPLEKLRKRFGGKKGNQQGGGSK